MSDTRDRSPVERARALSPLIREHADEADQIRHLPAPVAAAFAAEGLYRIGAPQRFHGEEADAVTQIETIEAVSEADGSAGWNLMIVEGHEDVLTIASIDAIAIAIEDIGIDEMRPGIHLPILCHPPTAADDLAGASNGDIHPDLIRVGGALGEQMSRF